MPAVILHTSVACNDDQKNQLAAGLSKLCASAIGKPESYVVSVVKDGATVYFGGEPQNAAMVQVSSIGGLDPKTNEQLSAEICQLLNEQLDTDPSKVYLNFTELKPHCWGWNGGTF